MDNHERRWVHQLCKQFGLVSKSSGKDARRFLTVRRLVSKNMALPVLELPGTVSAILDAQVDTSAPLDATNKANTAGKSGGLKDSKYGQSWPNNSAGERLSRKPGLRNDPLLTTTLHCHV